MYEAYGDFLVSNPVIRFIEIFLFLGMMAHAILGVILWIKNRMTRPIKYKFFRLQDNSPLSSRTTIWSGSVIGIFLYIHLKSFFIPSRFAAGLVGQQDRSILWGDGMAMFKSHPIFKSMVWCVLYCGTHCTRLSSKAWLSICFPDIRASK